LIDQRVTEHERSGIGRDIGNYLAQTQHCNPEVVKPDSFQRILDRIYAVIAERNLIELRRIVRKKFGNDLGDQATDRVMTVRVPNAEQVSAPTD